MKRVNRVCVAAWLAAASVAWTGCSQSSQKRTERDSDAGMNSTQAVQRVVARSSVADEELQQETSTKLNDAKLYCLGILLYAEKHQNECPTNLSQTLPYLHAADRFPSRTNHFEILYRGSFSKLPNPMRNGIILIRSESWKTTNGKSVRIYGFADGHCEAHVAPDGDFTAWEKQHSLNP